MSRDDPLAHLGTSAAAQAVGKRNDSRGFIDSPTEASHGDHGSRLGGAVAELCALFAPVPDRRPLESNPIGLGVRPAESGQRAGGGRPRNRVEPDGSPRALAAHHHRLGAHHRLFVVGAVYDLSGRRAARRLLPLMIGAAVAFFAINQILTGTFRVSMRGSQCSWP